MGPACPQQPIARRRTVSQRPHTPPVRIELSVNFGDREQDVLIEAPGSAPIGDALPALADSVGAPPDASIWCGSDPLPAAAQLADPKLRTGVRLSLGGALPAPDRAGILALHVVGGPAAGRVMPLERGEWTIGRAGENEVVLPDPGVSRRHAALEVSESAVRLYDAGSANGIRVDGVSVPPDGIAITAGAIMRLGDSLLSLAGPAGPPASVGLGPDGSLLLRRAPRPQPAPRDDVVVLPEQVAHERPRGVQWITALLPAGAGGAMAWVSGQPQFLLFALLSPAMLISTALGDRLHWRRARRRAAAGFRLRRAEAAQRIRAGLDAEAAQRRAAAPDPALLRRIVALPGTRVWERRREDADLLRVRVGSADLPATLAAREGAASAPAGTLAAVPLWVDLRRGPMGLAGPADVVTALGRWLVGQLAALTAPDDLEFALAADPAREPHWHWARWLPHLRSRVAANADESAALVAELADVVERRSAAAHRLGAPWPGPWLVVVVDLLTGAGHPGLGAVLDRGADVGISGIWLATDPAALPGSCESVGRVDGMAGTRLVLERADGVCVEAVMDQVSEEWATDVARSLAPLVDAGASRGATLPASCTLLDTLDCTDPTPLDIVNRWAGSDGGARILLGRGPDGVLRVDLASEGPHALIAGTTGAGKSELLRTMVAGLAVAHPPDELNLLLIDYKGGAAFADCVRLPHTTGLVTDLDPYLTERALRSLHCELRRRERLFAMVGAANLGEYRARPGPEPVPRLVIVVDEFAALADELPGFLPGLVGVAQRGRSLGLHLVLATQRPGSALSADIRANTSLRIALRVTDPGESSDVIDSSVAATIDRSNPGRGYLRAGPTLTCFQTAHASGSSDEPGTAIRVRPLHRWRRPSADPEAEDAQTDLARVVDTVRHAAHQLGHLPARAPWQPPLPDTLDRADLDPPDRRDLVVLGRVDLPDEQRLASFEVDLAAGGSLLVAGAPRSGRTTALLSLAVGAATALPPHELHLHVVDGTGDLADALRRLPHSATVLGPSDAGLVPRLLRRLERTAADRLAERPSTGAPRPTLLLLVDGWDTVCAALPDADAAACAELLGALLQVGAPAGLAVAVSGDRAVLTPRFAGGFGERVLLRVADLFDPATVGIRRPTSPGLLPPGRGFRGSDRALLQIAQAGSVVGRCPPGAPLGPTAIRIRPLPPCVRLTALPANPGRLTLGLAGDEALPVAIDAFAGSRRWLVAGPPRSGRSNTLRLLAEQAHKAGIGVLVAAPGRSPLTGLAHALGIPVLGPTDDALPVPQSPTLLLVDDSEAFTDSPAGDLLTGWARAADAPLAVVAAGRTDDVATAFRGVAAEVRRSRCGILLRPGPIDGELLGVRLPRGGGGGPPGRGIAVGEPAWGPPFGDGEPVPIQLAVL